jgi:hypothetical protein
MFLPRDPLGYERPHNLKDVQDVLNSFIGPKKYVGLYEGDPVLEIIS